MRAQGLGEPVRYLLGLCLMAFGLSACVETGGTALAPRAVVIADGAVQIKAPPSYCVDLAHTKDSRELGAFALVASCQALSSSEASPAIMTVSIGAQVGVDAITLDALVNALDGGKILSKEMRGDVAIVHLGEGGRRVVPGGDPRYWRAAKVVNGRLVSIALYARQGAPAAGNAGRSILLRLMGGISAAKTGAAPAVVAGSGS